MLLHLFPYFVAIYDISGRKVEQMTEGIYVIKVREGDKIVTKKVRK